MTTYNSYNQYWQQAQAQFPTNFLGYGQDDARRSKSPASLVNQPGYSPGPLSTPSHNPSQPPEGDPEQMMLDDHGDSLSNSPISVKTPDIDNDSLGDVEMLPGYGNCSMDSQMLQEPTPVVNSTQYFPDSFLSNLSQELQTTLASQAS